MARRRHKRIGLLPDQIRDGCANLESASQFLTTVCSEYPIKFDTTEPYGAAHAAIDALHHVGAVLTGDQELFSSQRRNPKPPFHKK